MAEKNLVEQSKSFSSSYIYAECNGETSVCNLTLLSKLYARTYVRRMYDGLTYVKLWTDPNLAEFIFNFFYYVSPSLRT